MFVSIGNNIISAFRDYMHMGFGCPDMPSNYRCMQISIITKCPLALLANFNITCVLEWGQ